MIPLIVLGVVFLLMMVRRIGNVQLDLWQIMGVGALVVLILRQISPKEAFFAVNWEVMLFLLSMFLIGAAMEESGYLAHVSYEVFKRARNTDTMVLCILFVGGIGSAFLMNDTLAIVGTPVMLHLARKHDLKPSFLLLTLAFAVTTGSVMSPLGNPQNFLIASEGKISYSLLRFVQYLGIPTIINLFVVYGFLRLFYPDQFHEEKVLSHSQEPIRHKRLAFAAKMALWILLVGIVVKIVVSLVFSYEIPLVVITVVAALAAFVIGDSRKKLVEKVDWHTLVFFMVMFILMRSVWNTGFFQGLMEKLPFSPVSPFVIGGVSVVVSQFLSNVPLVALYLPLVLAAGGGVKEMMVLAAGSTIAGNLSLLGAASNVIIVQNAEKRKGGTISFWEFLRIGFPLTVVNIVVYGLWFML